MEIFFFDRGCVGEINFRIFWQLSEKTAILGQGLPDPLFPSEKRPGGRDTGREFRRVEKKKKWFVRESVKKKSDLYGEKKVI